MSKKDKKVGKTKASILKASLPAHLANRIVNVKVKKPKKKDWLTFQDNYAEEKAKADAKLAALFTFTPNPERPVQFVAPRSLEKVQALVEPTKTYFEVQEVNTNNVAEFGKMPDGGLHVGVSNRSWIGTFVDINLTPEQFAAFKQWVMEN